MDESKRQKRTGKNKGDIIIIIVIIARVFYSSMRKLRPWQPEKVTRFPKQATHARVRAATPVLNPNPSTLWYIFHQSLPLSPRKSPHEAHMQAVEA